MDFEIAGGCAIIGLDEMLDRLKFQTIFINGSNKSVLNWNVSSSLAHN